jgi:hypothetical protein
MLLLFMSHVRRRPQVLNSIRVGVIIIFHYINLSSKVTLMYSTYACVPIIGTSLAMIVIRDELDKQQLVTVLVNLVACVCFAVSSSLVF